FPYTTLFRSRGGKSYKMHGPQKQGGSGMLPPSFFRLCFGARVGRSNLQPVVFDDLLVPVVAVLRRALQGAEVDVHDAEPLFVAEGPFEVVEQRPEEIAFQVDAGGDGAAE